MAFRSDISVRWDLSPRLITVAAPSTEVIIQDLHDTLRELEQRFANIIYPYIISTAGGEPLGGSVFVGFTATLQNAQINFEARYIRTSIGTSDTAGDPSTIIFTDNSATFISDGVERGATITNFDDQSFTTVVVVLSETQIRHEPLRDGYTNSWEIGDLYKIHNEIQCEITGGNLVAIDGYGNEIDAVSPTAFVQVIKASASSATDRNSQDVEYASFGGGVTVDLTSSYSGTIFPTGTPRQPVNNFQDALIISNQRGFIRFFIRGNAAIDSGITYDGIIFEGESQTKSLFTIAPDASVTGCEFECAEVTGILDGYSTLQHCNIGQLEFVDGVVENCVLSDEITLSGVNEATFLNCHSAVPGSYTPTINFGATGSALIMRNYNGGIKLTNKSGLESCSIDLNSGQVILDSSITNGEIVIRGIGKITDNSVGADVNSTDLIEGIKIQRLAYGHHVHVDTVSGTPGTTVGINGIPSNPVDTIDDAIVIGNEIGLDGLHIKGVSYLPQNLSTWTVRASGRGVMYFDGYDISGGTFIDMTLSGTISTSASPSFATDLRGDNCILVDGLTNLRGAFTNSILLGKITVRSDATLLLNGLASDEKSFRSSVIQIPPIPNSLPIIDVNGGDLTIQGLDGYLVIENVNESDSYAVISMNAGHVIIDSSCTDGDIIIRGNGVVTNEGTSNLVTTGTISSSEISSDTFKKLFPFVAD